MYTINLNDNPHEFEKQNLVTQIGNFDTLKCKKCGIKGKTSSLNTIHVKGSYSLNKVKNCIVNTDSLAASKVGKKIKITYCSAMGKIFENLKPDSIHLIIEVPENEKSDTQGVWVMGVGTPVKVLNNEFEYIN